MAVGIPVVRGAVSLGRVDLQVNIHCILHPLSSKSCTTVLNVGKFALLSCTMRFVLSDIHDLTIGCGFTNGANFCRSLQKSYELPSVVEGQNPPGTLTKSEDPIEEVGKEVQEKASVDRKFLFDGGLGKLLQYVHRKVVDPWRCSLGR